MSKDHKDSLPYTGLALSDGDFREIISQTIGFQMVVL